MLLYDVRRRRPPGNQRRRRPKGENGAKYTHTPLTLSFVRSTRRAFIVKKKEKTRIEKKAVAVVSVLRAMTNDDGQY